MNLRRTGWPALVASTAARVVLGTLALLMLASVVPALAGWQTSVVLSGSMAPALQPGDVVVVRPVDAATLHPGQIVLVDDPDIPGDLRIHRIAGLEGGSLRLRGDANPRADGSLVALSAVHGVGALRLPTIGLPALWLRQGRTAPLLLTGLALVALIGLALWHHSPEDGDRSDPVRRRRLPLRLRAAAPRLLALGAVGLVVAVLPGAGPARAVFNSVASNAGNSFSAGTYWSCADAVGAAGATQYYPLQESTGPTAVNKGAAGSAADATYSSTGVSYAAPGPSCAVGERGAVSLDGLSGAIAANNAVASPSTFTEQIWFATTTVSGGKLIGFGSSQTGASSNYDRHIFMLASGQLAFGVNDGSAREIVSPASYNDGTWHLATATLGANGMRLYVDGRKVGQDATASATQNFTGYWRIGYDSLDKWPNQPPSFFFAGALAQAAVFPTVLNQTDITDQYAAAPWSCADAAGAQGANAEVYLPLQETGGTTATNAGSAGARSNGTYASGASYTANGPNCGTNASGATLLNGNNGQVWTSSAVADPQTFTEQIWFSTSTTSGGRLIGFGTGTDGAQSNDDDRHIYLTNAGALVFGLYNGGYHTVTSAGPYNDGGWHLATASFSPGTGMRLYVDGAMVGTSTTATAAEHETGYWRIGYDNLGGWPSAPSTFSFTGSLAQASVCYRVLTPDEIAGQYLAGR